ncbi:rubredoxin [Pseudovibrio sp. SPO723]|uniref:rubredoxin n=1 Tax=Nesiotobacter zosterae TaxID=392721 RepID=UPI0029C5A398|nr:rubredoxin [Pseudovibrio sp. SPO723]MDX5594254.1 rubredoxin [Pseudovibrio sp. SPO723]
MVKLFLQSCTLPRRRFLQGVGSQVLAASVVFLAGHKVSFADAVDPMRRRRCPEDQCGYTYNPALGDRSGGIPKGVAFEDLPKDWVCPICGTPHEDW